MRRVGCGNRRRVSDFSPVPGVGRIVVLRANGLGDYVVAQPALAALRAAYPDAAITLVTSPPVAALLRGRPTPVDEVLRRREGVCQDFSHVMIAGLRALGLPARYTSGYIRTYPPPGQPRRVGALDVSDDEKARVARRLIALTDASKRDLARASGRLDLLLADLDAGRTAAAGQEDDRP